MPDQSEIKSRFCDYVTLGRSLKCAKPGSLSYNEVGGVYGALGYLFYRSLSSLKAVIVILSTVPATNCTTLELSSLPSTPKGTRPVQSLPSPLFFQNRFGFEEQKHLSL